jgi:hypothetical protein
MYGSSGAVGLLLPLTFGVVVMVCHGFQMPCVLVFFTPRVIQAHIESPLVGLGGVGDTVHQLEPEDILSCVRVWLATIAYADILLCSIGGIYNISNGKKLLPAFHR